MNTIPNKNLFLKPPGKGWENKSAIDGPSMFDFRTLVFEEIDEPKVPDPRTNILYYYHSGDPLTHPMSQLYDGTVLENIPSNWYDLINNKKIHVIISTMQESWGPVYPKSINHEESIDLDLVLENKAKQLGLDPSSITWLTGDLSAEKFYNNRCKVNIKSRCNFFNQLTCIVKDFPGGIEFFNSPVCDIEDFMICLNRMPKAHRGYTVARLYDIMGKDFYKINTSFPKELNGNTIIDAYVQLKIKKQLYNEYFDIYNVINWDRLAISMVKLYTELPFFIDVNNFDNNYCSGLDTFSSIKKTYDKSAFSLVTETWAEGKKLFISEAIMLSILHKTPFLLIGNKGTLEKLKEYGIETFDNIFDESYDTIEDDISRWDSVIYQVNSLSKLKKQEWLEKVNKVKDKLDHNFYQMFKVAEQEEQVFDNWLKQI